MSSNQYGYRIDISKPKYSEIYDRFKKWKGIPRWCPLSDAERFEFEEYVMKGVKNDVKNTETKEMQ